MTARLPNSLVIRYCVCVQLQYWIGVLELFKTRPFSAFFKGFQVRLPTRLSWVQVPSPALDVKSCQSKHFTFTPGYRARLPCKYDSPESRAALAKLQLEIGHHPYRILVLTLQPSASSLTPNIGDYLFSPRRAVESIAASPVMAISRACDREFPPLGDLA